MVDIDHFKAVNDTHGHTIGDLVLVEVAQAIKASTRATDLVGRFGGEEFVVLAPETPLEANAAGILAERIRQTIQRRTRAKRSQGLPEVTASLGVASTELKVANEAELLKRADEALYRAKREGRNRVVFATD